MKPTRTEINWTTWTNLLIDIAVAVAYWWIFSNLCPQWAGTIAGSIVFVMVTHTESEQELEKRRWNVGNGGDWIEWGWGVLILTIGIILDWQL
jgi:hypothetical protein